MHDKEYWINKFTEKAKTVHKRNLARFASRMYTRCTQWKTNLYIRSKKHGVPCSISVEDLRELLYDHYGTPCRYCGRTLDMNNLVLDHIIPISKGGSSNLDNLQIICRTSNGIKGSLDESHFILLTDWLQTIPEELRKDISIRLARGVR